MFLILPHVQKADEIEAHYRDLVKAMPSKPGYEAAAAVSDKLDRDVALREYARASDILLRSFGDQLKFHLLDVSGREKDAIMAAQAAGVANGPSVDMARVGLHTSMRYAAATMGSLVAHAIMELALNANMRNPNMAGLEAAMNMLRAVEKRFPVETDVQKRIEDFVDNCPCPNCTEERATKAEDDRTPGKRVTIEEMLANLSANTSRPN
jgi:hypothetical protein